MIERSPNLCRTRRPNLQLSLGHCPFGIVVTLLVLCHIAEVTGDDRFVDRYHRLLDYASQRPESAEISAAID
ncbi:antirestriction protein [Burkholderia vietnamiensis]|nr:antirestriction protein [Burkholderia vietnamiensis]